MVNYDLACVYKWLLANKISLNCSKTELIIFHKPGYPIQDFNFKIKINGHKITPTDHIKYLGIYLDSTLSGKHHCEILAKKLKRANGMLSKVRHYVPKDELRSIYYAIFLLIWFMAVKFGGKDKVHILIRFLNYKIEPCVL